MQHRPVPAKAVTVVVAGRSVQAENKIIGNQEVKIIFTYFSEIKMKNICTFNEKIHSQLCVYKS